MSDELTRRLIDYLNSTEVFIKEQAPDFVRQALEYYAWNARFSIECAAFFACVGIALLGIAITVAWKERKRSWLDRSEATCFTLTFAGSLILIASLATASCSYSSLQKLKIAPKLYLLEELRGGCH